MLTNHSADAVGAQVERGVRALREGEVMGAYIDFDRTADRAWTPAEYLVRFGEFVSQRTAEVNNGERLACRGLPQQVPNEHGHLLTTQALWDMYVEDGEPLAAAGDERSNSDSTAPRAP